jgi:hypothetical protein
VIRFLPIARSANEPVAGTSGRVRAHYSVVAEFSRYLFPTDLSRNRLMETEKRDCRGVHVFTTGLSKEDAPTARTGSIERYLLKKGRLRANGS